MKILCHKVCKDSLCSSLVDPCFILCFRVSMVCVADGHSTVRYHASYEWCKVPRHFVSSFLRAEAGGSVLLQHVWTCSIYQNIRRPVVETPSTLYISTSRQIGWSLWPRGLRRVSAAARFLGIRVRIPPGAWMSVSCECCVLSGRGLYLWLIIHPEESYRVWRVYTSAIVKPR
jgi:hypothetical protein